MTLRSLFIASTLLFWNGVVIYAVKCPRAPACTPAADAANAADKAYPISEVARHARPEDCWIAIAGEVYNVSGFIDLHPGDTELLKRYCGRESTQPYAAKESGKHRGKPHTPRADSFLEEYRVGRLQQ